MKANDTIGAIQIVKVHSEWSLHEVDTNVRADHRLIFCSEGSDLDNKLGCEEATIPSADTTSCLKPHTLRNLLREHDGLRDGMLAFLDGALNLGIVVPT